MTENGVVSEYTFRDATKEEQQSVADYIDSISVDTGYNLWNVQEQVKISDDIFQQDCEDLMEIICDNYSMYERMSIDKYTNEIFNYIKSHIENYHKDYEKRLNSEDN